MKYLTSSDVFTIHSTKPPCTKIYAIILTGVTFCDSFSWNQIQYELMILLKCSFAFRFFVLSLSVLESSCKTQTHVPTNMLYTLS